MRFISPSREEAVPAQVLAQRLGHFLREVLAGHVQGEEVVLRRHAAELYSHALDGYRRCLYYSFHTTAGYLEQSLASRLTRNRASIEPYVDLFRRLVKRNPSNSEAHYYLGITLMFQHHADVARLHSNRWEFTSPALGPGWVPLWNTTSPIAGQLVGRFDGNATSDVIEWAGRDFDYAPGGKGPLVRLSRQDMK